VWVKHPHELHFPTCSTVANSVALIDGGGAAACSSIGYAAGGVAAVAYLNSWRAGARWWIRRNANRVFNPALSRSATTRRTVAANGVMRLSRSDCRVDA
jgi:hypothetical protein